MNLVGLAGLFAVAAIGACGSPPPELGSTSQLAIVTSPAHSHDFAHVTVGQSSAPVTFTVSPQGIGANEDLITAITEACPDFSVDAEGLPAEVSRVCNGSCPQASLTCQEPQAAPLICQNPETETYEFTALFTPTVAGSVSCTVTITTQNTHDSLTLTLSGVGDPPPIDIDVSPASIAFGDVRIATDSSPATVTVRSLGGSTLHVSSVAASDGFSVGPPTAFDLPPGTSQALAVKCTPPDAGAKSGMLTIASDDPDEGTVQVPLTCNGVDSTLGISPSPATIATRVGEPATTSVTITNEADAPTGVRSVSIAGTGLTLARTLGPDTVLDADGGTATVDVAFDASAHGDANGTLTFTTDAETRTVEINAHATLASMSLAPDGAVDLGPVCPDATASQIFTIVANGDGPFKVESVSMPDAPFTVVTPSLPTGVLPSGGNEVTFTVAVSPTAEGSASTQVTVTTDIPNDRPRVLEISALGLPPGTSATPSELDLGASPLEQTTIGQAVTLTNCDKDDVGFSNARIEGPDAGDFAIVAQPDGATIAAGGSGRWLVVLTAHSAGVKQATFSVDTPAGTSSVALTGEGLAPDTGSGSGSDDVADGEHNYYSCRAGGGAGGLVPVAFAAMLAARRRRRGAP